jgi:hypothetical protein
MCAKSLCGGLHARIRVYQSLFLRCRSIISSCSAPLSTSKNMCQVVSVYSFVFQCVSYSQPKKTDSNQTNREIIVENLCHHDTVWMFNK